MILRKALVLALIVLSVVSLGLRKKEAPPPAPEATADQVEAQPIEPRAEEATLGTIEEEPGQEAAPVEESAEPGSETAVPAEEEALAEETGVEDFTVVASEKKDLIVIKVFSQQFNSITAATLVDPKNEYAMRKLEGRYQTEVTITKSMLKTRKYQCKVYIRDALDKVLFKKVEINL